MDLIIGTKNPSLEAVRVGSECTSWQYLNNSLRSTSNDIIKLQQTIIRKQTNSMTVIWSKVDYPHRLLLQYIKKMCHVCVLCVCTSVMYVYHVMYVCNQCTQQQTSSYPPICEPYLS